jgi:acyl-CoA synthetase (AMP-forming)/AMP-acid ligase II
LIIFTSGTTEHPRAVVHSRTSLGAGLAGFAEAVGFTPGDRVLTDQLMVGIPALIAGAHWRFPPVGADPGAKPEAYVPLLDDADVLFAVPAALSALLPHLAGKQLRTVIVGGAPVLRPLLERLRTARPDTSIRAIYGMTEVLPVAIADGAEKLARTEPGDYVGRLAPHVTVRIDDGEVVVSGDGVALRYLGEPDLTEVRSGDLGRLDGDHLTLLGRSKEMFIRGTTNVYPALYEPVIAGLPGVDEAALIGVPDEIGDDRIVLAYAGSASEESIRAALRGLIDSAVLPDRIVKLPELPHSGRNRKLDRATLAGLLA